MEIKYYDLGKRIQTARKEKGLTQEELAEKVGVGNSHISHVETGKAVPSFALVVNIMNALGLTPDELICGYINHSNANLPLKREIAGILEDCSARELQFLSGCLMIMKTLLRSYDSAKEEG